MANEKQQATAKGGKGGKGKGGKKGEAKQRGPHAGAGLPVPPPRLKAFYQGTVRPKLSQQFGFTNPHQVPHLEKIVLNVGVGEAIKQPKALDSVVDELATITGQQPVRKKAKKSIANFGLRQGQEIGAAVTLRGARMWEFLDRFISVAIPRIRDFRGLGTKSFDGRGNYSLGIKEQMIFPEINYDEIESIHGMDITFVTSTTKDDQAFALLRELGMPFRMDEKKTGKRDAGRGTRAEAVRA
jgi:large subunit ribosomal protein L5